MAYLAHFINFKKSDTSNKIPEYAKDFKNEWLYITGINRKCGEFMKILGDNTDSFEKVFLSSRARALFRDFKNVLEAQKVGKLQNISKLKFKLSAVSRIIDIREDLYFHMGNTFYDDFFEDDNFRDFFENFIVFINNVKIKNEEEFENDLFEEYDDLDEEIQREREREREDMQRILNEIVRGDESESESESEIESESESESD